MDEVSRERLTDKVYRTLIDLYTKQEEVRAEYQLRLKGCPDTKEPA